MQSEIKPKENHEYSPSNREVMNDIAIDMHSLLFGVRRSARYRNRRRRFFDNVYRIKTALSLLAGSTAMVTILAAMGNIPPLIASAFVTLISTIDLVMGSSTKGRLHADLARRFIELERLMTVETEPTDERVRNWTAQQLLIEADEPPVLRVLDILCHNELLLAMGYPREQLYSVPCINDGLLLLLMSQTRRSILLPLFKKTTSS